MSENTSERPARNEQEDTATCRFSVEFESDCDYVSMTSSSRYVRKSGLANQGWCFGLLFAEVAKSLKPHITDWDSFVACVTHKLEEEES